MRRMVLLLLSFLVFAPFASACSCIPPNADAKPLLSNGLPAPTREQLTEKDLVIFLADAVDVKELKSDGYPVQQVKFRVIRSWSRGVERDTIVQSGNSWIGCTLEFTAGRRYIVFASKIEGRLFTDHCTPTTPLSVLPDLLDYLQQNLGPGRTLK